MSTSSVRALTALATVSATVVTGLSTPAMAAPPGRESFHDSFSFTVDDFCGSEGLSVRLDRVVDGRIQYNARGSDRLAYFMEHVRFAEVITNLANGEHVRVSENTTSKDLRVTDNGDGTLTILVLGTGNATIYGSDGKAIARNPGQVRFEVLVDHAGTPTDPLDDHFLEFLGVVKESTGRSDDFCSAVVAALT